MVWGGMGPVRIATLIFAAACRRAGKPVPES